MPMMIKGKLHSASGSGPDMVKHVDVVVVVDSDGAEVVLELEVPVLEDGGVAETPEIIANMNNDKPKKESRKDIF